MPFELTMGCLFYTMKESEKNQRGNHRKTPNGLDFLRPFQKGEPLEECQRLEEHLEKFGRIVTQIGDTRNDKVLRT